MERTSHWSASMIASKDRRWPVNIHGCWSVMSSNISPHKLPNCSPSEYLSDFNMDPNNDWTSYMAHLSESHVHSLFQLLSGLNEWIHSVILE